MIIPFFSSKTKVSAALLAGVLLLLSVSASAQGNLTVTGTVREASGEPS